LCAKLAIQVLLLGYAEREGEEEEEEEAGKNWLWWIIIIFTSSFVREYVSL